MCEEEKPRQKSDAEAVSENIGCTIIIVALIIAWLIIELNK